MLSRLKCSVQTYDWGRLGEFSTVSQLASLNGDIKIDSAARYAEYWFGTHHAGPSSVRGENKEAEEALGAWLSHNEDALGAMTDRPDCVVADNFCGLPYLAKVLSIDRCLSIQAHPDKALAEKLHAERPEVYKDPNHKPEMAIALTPFEAMCGFRRVEEILGFIATVPEFQAILVCGETSIETLQTAAQSGDAKAISTALQNVFRVYANADKDLVAAQVDVLVARVTSASSSAVDVGTEADPSGKTLAESLAVRLASQFSGDIGVFAPFLLNFMRLKPGDAIFLAANEPHAYISGDCFEVMANSNNVVRMGCTPKLRDIPVLTEMLTFSSGLPTVLSGEPLNDSVRIYKPTDPAVTEFQVERVEVASGESCKLTSPSTPAIIIVLKGDLTLSGVTASRGHVFVQRAGTELEVAGSGETQLFRVQCRE
jgi:mannose-6-phosphate isomerase